MPNPNIRYNGNDRPFVQYELPELRQEIFTAVKEDNHNVVHDIYNEMSFRRSRRAKKFQHEIGLILDKFF